MADQAALIGLIGAIGGAAVGAGGAVLGPMLLHRRQASELRRQEARLDERELARARMESERDERHHRAELAQRLINLRASTRSYLELLRTTHLTLAAGTTVDPEVFEEKLTSAESALNHAFDEALLDGIWFAHAAAASFLIAQGSMLDALGRGTPVEERVDVTTLGHDLSSAAYAVSACVRAGTPVDPDLRTEAERALDRAETARAELAAYIKGRLDARGPEMPGRGEGDDGR